MVGRPESFFCSVRFLQCSRAEKCKAWRTTDFPAVRHTLGVRCWCAHLHLMRRPPRPPGVKQADTALWPRCEGVGAFLFRWMPKFGRINAVARAAFSTGRTGRLLRGREITIGTKVKDASPVTSPPVRQPNDCCPRKRHVWGTRQSRWFSWAGGFAV